MSGQIFLGDRAFIARVVRKAQSPRDLLKAQRAWKSLQMVERESEDRNAAIRAADALGHYSLCEIGAHFALHEASISKVGRYV